MSFRTDISIEWLLSPRIITVPFPSVEITVQDLFDTLRSHEDDPVNLVYLQIVRATGKEVLTSSLRVGITCTLLNAKILFNGHIGFTRIDIKGGNLLAVDDMDVAMSPIVEADFTQIVYDLSPTPTLVSPPASSTRSYPIIIG